MITAFLFPGQGSQKVGMGKDLIEASASAKRRYEEANDIMGIDLAKLSFEGPEEILRRTEVTQPALFVASVALAELIMAKGLTPSFSAGHSLGEYSALTTAGVFTFTQALALVKLRGDAMSRAGQERSGTMAAVIGLDADAVKCICDKASEGVEVAVPANFNSPGQIVISGNVDAVKNAMKLAEESGAIKAIELNVSGAFHSPLMDTAKMSMKKALDEISLSRARFPVVMNISAEAVSEPNEIKENLIRQLDNPVRWIETVETLRDLGATDFVEVGPGRVLQGLNHRIDRTLSTRGIERFDQIKELAIA
ncbi:MAG TPA: ACP S-malonyltransferase [Candidatus Marinimicrobia bacterium]|jgi:[acyl-carrier-protein] S-malonyltransferase|nr:ACP S-malonyltransferase [Candidatus Neomarinimicrobiota bacterium]HIB72124.1 ACP S-malonyltransferase [Candidatus Neomarinimicrobiota bacterium]HIN62944.1 [acyl-carrier-protein] S-malonyltransferase [Candidatus Neomarinimicrobiota bacterium]HIO37005.1 [acyl-carrier-protein] S-malonyltransferase [Candidatus Neomarinimicrobiota bacterium]